jgi:hypothetical protein
MRAHNWDLLSLYPPRQDPGLAGSLRHMNGLLQIAITMLSRVSLEVNRVSQPIPPIKAVFTHYLDNAATLRGNVLGSPGACSDT